MKKTMLTKENLQKSWDKMEEANQIISIKKSMLSEDVRKMMEFNEAYELKRTKTRDKLKLIIDTFNEMLHSGHFTSEQCYGWLQMEHNRYDYEIYKNYGFHPITDFAFLYPEHLTMSEETLKEFNKL